MPDTRKVSAGGTAQVRTWAVAQVRRPPVGTAVAAGLEQGSLTEAAPEVSTLVAAAAATSAGAAAAVTAMGARLAVGAGDQATSARSTSRQRL